MIITQVAYQSWKVFRWGGVGGGGIQTLDFRGATVTLASELANQGDGELGSGIFVI